MARFTGDDLTCVRGERMVFSALGFQVDEGGALVLVGANGSGKSSLLRLMAGLLRPAGGSLAWDGGGISDDPQAHGARLHYVGHLDAIKPVLGVRENLAFWSAMNGGAGGRGDGVDGALEAFGIGHLAEVPGRFLSAGQRRRLNQARIVATPAWLWLLDEPATALDAAAVASLEDAIAGHRAGGGMVVAATHAELGIGGAEILDLDAFSDPPAGAVRGAP